MRNYIAGGCLGLAIFMHFAALALQTVWPMGTWPFWLRLIWCLIFGIAAIIGVTLACDWDDAIKKKFRR